MKHIMREFAYRVLVLIIVGGVLAVLPFVIFILMWMTLGDGYPRPESDLPLIIATGIAALGGIVLFGVGIVFEISWVIRYFILPLGRFVIRKAFPDQISI